MKLVTSAGQLREACLTVLPTVQRGSVPILACVKITRRVMTSTNLDMRLTVQFAITSGTKGFKAVVEHRQLMQLTAALDPDTEVTLSVGGDEVALSWPGARYLLRHLNPDDFPAPPQATLGETDSFACDNWGFRAALARVSYAMSKEETRYYLSGVCLSRDREGTPCIVATDGHQLAACKLPAASGFKDQIVPREAAVIIQRLGEPSRLELSEQHARFAWPSVTLDTRLIDVTYPDWARIMPGPDSPPAGLLTLPPGPTFKALRRMRAAIQSRQPSATLRLAANGDVWLAGEYSESSGCEHLTGAHWHPRLAQVESLALTIGHLQNLLTIAPDASLMVCDDHLPVIAQDGPLTALLMPCRGTMRLERIDQARAQVAV